MKSPDTTAPGPGRWSMSALQLSRDKSDTLLLLAAVLAVLAPHAAHLPPWATLVCAVTLLWRGLITFRGIRMPPPLLLLPLSLLAMGGVYNSFHTWFGRDAGVAMLTLLVAFKMLEMHARRDLFVVIFLSFFLVLSNFFYSQSIATACMMIVAIVALLCAQLSFQYTGAVPPLWRRLRQSARMLALAAPLALLLFVVFPRINGSLWGMPNDAHGGRTGLSDSMAPGNLSSLAESDETAFRVSFSGPVPAQEQLYWRAIVLSDFDGRSWRRAQPGRQAGERGALPDAGLTTNAGGAPLHYTVTLEASGTRYLMALELPDRMPVMPGNPVALSPQLEMTSFYPIEQRTRYEATARLGARFQADADSADMQQYLALPAGLNRRAMELGRALGQEPDRLKRIEAVLRRFNKDGYSYTLEPPLLGTDSIDEFLFSTRAGFCEHYAGAFVFLMRAAGIPARVVTGYQGGERNPVDGYLTVRQSDAHAWSEVWLRGRGWVRVDPTAAVAPERVQRSLARALPPPRAPFGIAGLGPLINFTVDRNSWIMQLRFRIAAINNGWNQWFLNYTPERQREVLDALGRVLFKWQPAAGLLAIAILVALLRAVRARGRIDRVDALYSALCQQLGRHGHARAADEGPNAYAARLAALPMEAQRKAAIARFLALYSAHKYAPPRSDPTLPATLKSLLKNASR
jgi:protein-glutamine gamma-glutamyltransferase